MTNYQLSRKLINEIQHRYALRDYDIVIDLCRQLYRLYRKHNSTPSVEKAVERAIYWYYLPCALRRHNHTITEYGWETHVGHRNILEGIHIQYRNGDWDKTQAMPLIMVQSLYSPACAEDDK